MNTLLEENQKLCKTASYLGHHASQEETIHTALQWYINYLKSKKQRTLWDAIQELRNSPDFIPIDDVDEIFNVRSKETGRANCRNRCG